MQGSGGSEGTMTYFEISALALHHGAALGELRNYFGSLFLAYKAEVTAIVLWRKCDNTYENTQHRKYFMNGSAVTSVPVPFPLKFSIPLATAPHPDEPLSCSVRLT